MTTNEKKIALQNLYNTYRDCPICPYGKTENNHKVFGMGNLNAKIFFIGEAPGEQEDLQKRPFVGRAGKLLNESMEKAGFSREEIFITNIVKCRPPNNRTPTPEEITPAMKELLQKEIEIIDPVVICTLGATSARTLLNHPVSMTQLRGTISSYHGYPLIHVYHPAYIFRNWGALDTFISDLKKVYEFSEK